MWKKRDKDKSSINKKRIAEKIINFSKTILFVAAGALIFAYAYHALIVPYGLLASGVSGISIMIEYLTGFPFVISMVLLNIPIFIWGLIELKWKYMVSCLLGITFSLTAISLTANLFPTPDIDIFLAAVFSGVLTGISSGLGFKVQVSSGGIDTMSMILKKKKNISVGATSFSFNMLVMAASLLFFDIMITLYTMVSIYIAGKVIDVIIEGLNRNKAVTIISDKSLEIAGRIHTELNRGVTFIKGEGAFTNQEKKVINCVVTHYEIAVLKKIIHEEDPSAFMYFSEAVEVSGKGFSLRK